MKEYFFISGLPRSGSTLLSAILRQNPEFYADISSPVHPLAIATIGVLTNSEVNQIVTPDRRRQIIQDVFEAFYKGVSNPIVFDTHRAWTSRTALLKSLFPSTKVLCCVRDIPWILDSFERITMKNSLYGSTFTDSESGQTVSTRCEAMMDVKKEGQVIKPYCFLEEGLSLNPDMIHLIEYDDLCGDPEGTMRKIYAFIGKPYFPHDFDNVEYSNTIFDQAMNMEGMHTIRKKVAPQTLKTILPESVWNRYAGKEFWRPKAAKYAEVYKMKVAI